MTSSEQQKQQSDDDITSQKGMQDASSGSSSLSKYLKQMGDLQREAFEKVYDAVDQPCMHEPCLPTCETDMDQFLMVRNLGDSRRKQEQRRHARTNKCLCPFLTTNYRYTYIYALSILF